VTDTPREQDQEGDDPSTAGSSAPADGDEPTTGAPAGAAARSGPATSRRRFAFAPVIDADPASEAGRQQRRRRRFFVAGISVAAAVIVIALCAGVLGAVSAIGGFRDRAADARDTRQQRNTECLELDQRLNRLAPPGAATTPQARAKAVRDENAAVRIYVQQNRSARDQDAWRQLLDARTAYAEALDQQAKSRTPAFYVAPRTDDGSAVSDELARWSPASCAGAIRRLATPDL
jgi:hypothetical protein